MFKKTSIKISKEHDVQKIKRSYKKIIILDQKTIYNKKRIYGFKVDIYVNRKI